MLRIADDYEDWRDVPNVGNLLGPHGNAETALSRDKEAAIREGASPRCPSLGLDGTEPAYKPGTTAPSPPCLGLRNKWMPGALGKQPVAHLPPTPCSAGYPGRSRQWLRPRRFLAAISELSRAMAGQEQELPAQFALIERLRSSG